ncbi:bifunctional aspartate kinase/homoserine dehydrogenase II [Colwellia sp. MB02u-14]|uniref:bifunctional aspartate kinase/homoserine dehydrogenase II n=1 Tax=Colwellia sp. MB02u-14 TaxID=2759815 RepID=UPI0015F73036|nr:bifunctional aspartate kinase/homoserine dehydrogenase II [Colwellia sp. MB02u-14]MBA6301984.1 bifunctional aspartate kinase/homoserine dehydrogenase II [Colwellia sp. MB02u-14]
MTQSNTVEPLSSGNNQLAKHAIHAHKFGGSSLATTQCIERVVAIIRKNCQLDDLVVVSANGNTTDDLFNIYELAVENSQDLLVAIEALKQSQSVLISELLNKSRAACLIEILSDDIDQLTVWLTEQPRQHHADMLAYGEVWSARLLSAVLSEQVCPSYSIDARDFLVINNDKECAVDNQSSKKQFQEILQKGKLAVITGYITKNSRGETCTLGRNGSDYSATIIASLSGALNVTLWTDVDGIYSADPRVVPLARKLHRLPNGVAKELGRLGNPVLHAKTLQPLTNHSTHLHVASSFDPEISGTEIGKFGQIAKQELSVTSLNDLLLVQSTSLTGSLAGQANHEFSAICSDVKQGFIVIHRAQQKLVSQWLANHDTDVSFTPVSILAIVGHSVVNQGNIQARFKRALKHSKVLYVVNSLSEHSIIAVLQQSCTGELLNNVHHDMTKDARHIGVVVAGLGNIGQRFLELLPGQLNRIPALENVHLVGLVASNKALLNTDGIDVVRAIKLYERDAKAYDNALLMSWLTNHPYDELIVVDITPSEHFSYLYGDFFREGIHVIGANKWAASSSTKQYNTLVSTAAKNKSLWLGNTTVGAGLPINFAINDLLNSGDQIIEISGIFSGTLSWLFETYDGSVPFSRLLLDALSQGITEPDPREDLSGRDVQRKLLILARMAGFELSLEDIDCQNLVPESLQGLSIKDFLAKAAQLDTYFAEQLAQASAKQSCIRYIAEFAVNEQGKSTAKVHLAVLPNNDAFTRLTPCDNIFLIKSLCYQDNPLIIQGPGAGRDVTAGGLHSDLVSICQQLAGKKHQVKIKGLS